MLKPVPKQDLKCAQTGADPQLAGNAASMERANNVGAALEPCRATVFSVMTPSKPWKTRLFIFSKMMAAAKPSLVDLHFIVFNDIGSLITNGYRLSVNGER